jgi:phosphatidylserine/phosphatidylglycerophosphate/cardiolipin synthase-like enzyme
MGLGGSGDVLTHLKELGARDDIFSYGVAQSTQGLSVYRPEDTKGIFTSFAYLGQHVPPPFEREWSGGAGQVIHHKFVVVDFNDTDPVVFTGSSNLASGGEEDNGDNLLAIYDPSVAKAYAVEAIRLVDHYHFRAVMKEATSVEPLVLKPDEAGW